MPYLDENILELQDRIDEGIRQARRTHDRILNSTTEHQVAAIELLLEILGEAKALLDIIGDQVS